jgi:hypothetical protein
MSINNFLGASINAAGTLTVFGQTLDAFDGQEAHLPVGATMEIVVIADADDGKRCFPQVSNLALSAWQAESPAAEHEFEDKEKVCAVGVLKIAGEPDFVWGKTFPIGKPAFPK